MDSMWGQRHLTTQDVSHTVFGLPMTKSAAVSMFHFCARHYKQIGVYSKIGVRLKISLTHNVNGEFPDCASCETLTGSTWTTETIPELPYEKCINACGCHCLALADVEQNLSSSNLADDLLRVMRLRPKLQPSGLSGPL